MGKADDIMKKEKRSKLITIMIIISLFVSAIMFISNETFVMAGTNTVGKVTGFKKSKVIDGFKFISKNNNYCGNYRKLSWNKVKKAKGYQLYRYDYLNKKWQKVLTTSKNKIKITSLMKGEKVKFKVRAYRKVNGNTVYGKYSKTITYTEKFDLAYEHNGKIIKKNCYVEQQNGCFKEAAKQAFMIQNEYRVKAGLHELKWNDKLYDIAMIRAKDQTERFGHKRPDGKWFWQTFEDYLGLDKYIELGADMAFSENAARGQQSAKEVMTSWYNSKGHRENFMDKEWNYGAIACYEGNHWISTFSINEIK